MELSVIKNKNIFKIFNSLIVMYVCFFLSGCISTIRLKPEDAQMIKAIEVNKNVVKPKIIFYENQTEVFLSNFSPLGYVIYKQMHESAEQKEIQDIAEKARAKISEILQNEVLNQLKQNGKFKIATTRQGANAVLNLEIETYGLSAPNGGSSKLGPILTVIGNLTNSKNKIIWKDIVSINPYFDRQMPKFSRKELLQDPHNIYLAWDEAAKEAAKRLVKSLES